MTIIRPARNKDMIDLVVGIVLREFGEILGFRLDLRGRDESQEILIVIVCEGEARKEPNEHEELKV